MKLLYNIAGTYRAAGMERVLACKANWLARQVDAQGKPEYEVIVATTDQRGQAAAFAMDARIRTVDFGVDYELNNGRSFLNKLLHYPLKQLKHRRALWRLLQRERPDIVVSMFCNDASFVPGLARRISARSVLEIHFSRFKRLQYGRKGIWAVADRLLSRNDLRTVRRFDRFVVLTEEDRGYWGEIPNIRVIPNPRTFSTDRPSELSAKTVLAVGRYSFQKQFEALISAWALLRLDFPDWKLRIAGDGEDRAFLEKRIADHRMEDKVVLGPERDMEAAYRKASVLALSSRFEGLPMVLLEAQAMGLPVVSFECKCGPKDVISDGVDGFLVKEGDVTEFADKLFALMSDAGLRRRMGTAAYRASERFDEEKIMKKWAQLFGELS